MQLTEIHRLPCIHICAVYMEGSSFYHARMYMKYIYTRIHMKPRGRFRQEGHPRTDWMWMSRIYHNYYHTHHAFFHGRAMDRHTILPSCAFYRWSHIPPRECVCSSVESHTMNFHEYLFHYIHTTTIHVYVYCSNTEYLYYAPRNLLTRHTTRLV